MPMKKYSVSEGHYVLLECKTCGARVKVMPEQRRIMKIRCRSCKGTRFRTVTE